jgi:hypothetical protein
MEKYLKHPSREPDYRGNRSHKKFVTSLKDEKYSIKLPKLVRDLESTLSQIQF